MELFSLAERPQSWDRVWEVEGAWPRFMEQDPISQACYVPAMRLYPDLHFLAWADDRPVARVHAVAIPWSGAESLPDRGWDWALGSAVGEPRADRSAVSLIEIRIDPGLRGRGLSHWLVRQVRERLAGSGTMDLVGPVRPNGLASEPGTPAAAYIERRRPDGLPVDDWLRVHVRAGGRIVKVAPLSMTIPAPLEQWREWTGLPFDTDAPVLVDGGLAPVLVSQQNQTAVYLEPNVWVHHDLRAV